MTERAQPGGPPATSGEGPPPLPGYALRSLPAERTRLAQQVRALLWQNGRRWPAWIDARPGGLQLLLADCVDAPLSATRRHWLIHHGEQLAEGLSLMALSLSAPRLSLWLRDDVEPPAALARLETRTAPRAFPSQPERALPAAEGRVLALPAEQLVAISALLRQERAAPPLDARISVVGAVAKPAVVAVTDAAVTARQLVAGVGGATTSAWVPLFADPLAGPLWEADRPLPLSPAGDIPSVLYVLPAGHPLIRRHRASFSLRQRAANTCQACRLCTDLCPTAVQGTQPHLLMRALGQESPPKLSAETLAMTAGCTRCGACSAACPAGLLPGAIVSAFAAALPSDLAGDAGAAEEPPPSVELARLPWSHMLARLGLDGFAPAQP